MKIKETKPPRPFQVGPAADITLYDCGVIDLADDEQVTFRTADGAEHDFVRKSWGFYATPSVNGRLPSFGLRTALMESVVSGRRYVVVVDGNKIDEFRQYLSDQKLRLLGWLDGIAPLTEDTLPPAGS
jgi:hypothetical protein